MAMSDRVRPDTRPGEPTEAAAASPALRGWWQCVLDVALVVWILRVPVATTAFGWLLLGLTPQAQDLFTEYLDLRPGTWVRMLSFVLVLIAMWALPTHYAARLLIDSDARAPARDPAPCLSRSAVAMPRLLGVLTFLAVELAIWRSYANMPTLDQHEVTQGVAQALTALAVLVALAAAAYAAWVRLRPRYFRLTGVLGHFNYMLGGF